MSDGAEPIADDGELSSSLSQGFEPIPFKVLRCLTGGAGDAADERQAVVRPSAGLQRDPAADGAAASYAGVDSRELSFKHTVQLWTQRTARGLSAAGDDHRLFALIAQCKAGHRPGRIEPRMRKRRPKP